MSADSESSSPRLPPPERRSGCATAVMVLFGLVLLFPGLCTALLGAGGLTQGVDAALILVVIFGVAAAFGGVMLIRAAIRSPNS